VGTLGNLLLLHDSCRRRKVYVGGRVPLVGRVNTVNQDFSWLGPAHQPRQPQTVGTNVESGTRRELFATAGMTNYEPSPDGERFLVNVPADGEGAAAPPITVVLDWTAGLKK
jgi:hypothetical protein